MKYFLICAGLIISSNLWAGANIFFKKGSLTISGKEASKGDSFKAGDVVKTGAKSIAVLAFPSGSKVKLSENSSYKIEKISEEQVKTKLDSGDAFFNVIKKKLNSGKKSKFTVRTKTAAMGVRGTEFFVAYGKKGSKDVWMCVNEGTVAVKSSKEKKSTLVKAGEGIVIKDGKDTSDPKPLAWTKKLNWGMDPNKGDLENKVSIEEAYADPLNVDYD